MPNKLKSLARAVRVAIARLLRRTQPHLRPEGPLAPAGEAEADEPLRAESVFDSLVKTRRAVLVTAGLGFGGWLLVAHPPIATAAPGELGVRTNQLTGTVVQWRDGSILVVPGLHQAQVFSLHDRSDRPQQMTQSTGSAPLQSMGGLSVGVDVNGVQTLEGCASAVGQRVAYW